MTTIVTTAAELVEAVAAMATLEAPHREILVDGEISGMPSITLPPGTVLRGGTLRFGGRGVLVTRDNELHDITIETSPAEVAIGAITSEPTLGTLTLSNVQTVGQISLVAEDALTSGTVIATNVWVRDADLRGREHRPHDFGVDVLQGGFLIWNRQADSFSTINATLRDIRIGAPEHPVRGSGVMVFGGAPEGAGLFTADHVSTLEIITDGGIVPGTPDVISGGVFVGYGAHVDEVINDGPVSTRGANDMVLDNWGTVRRWHARRAVTSTGPSGIGFVNFGDIDELIADRSIETHGVGARGFNQYAGSLSVARFNSIRTTGDGAVGIQLSVPTGRIEVRGSLTTSGSIGMSLVKGVQMSLSATAFSITSGAHLDALHVHGDIRTTGDRVNTVELNGTVGDVEIGGRVEAAGTDSRRVVGDDVRFIDSAH